MEKRQQIWKFTIPVDDQDHEISIPNDYSAIVAVEVDLDPSRVDFWVQFYYTPGDDIPERTRTFRVFGTGHPAPVDMEWVGTSRHRETGLVWHLFEYIALQGEGV